MPHEDWGLRQGALELQAPKSKCLSCGRYSRQPLPGILRCQRASEAFQEAVYQFGETLNSWRAEIAAMWLFTPNNGITEGFHNKMELINRQAYSFRNFENYRLRVKVLCS